MEGLILRELVLGNGLLRDVSKEDISKMSAAQLMQLLRLANERLRELGAVPANTQTSGAEPASTDSPAIRTYRHTLPAPRRLRITRTLRIYLEGRCEICLKPLCKTVFLLYLKHPEGIDFKDLALHRQELCDIYSRLSRRSSPDAVERSIDRLLDLGSNNISTQRSQLVRGLSAQVEKEILPHYLLEGKPGQTRKIPLDRDLIEWEL